MKKIFLILTILFIFFIADAADATTVFSPLIEIEIDPGQRESGIVKVYNETNSDIYLTSSIESFKAGDETGQPIYVPDDQKDGHLSWFDVAEKEIILKSKQVGVIPFSVMVPSDAAPGGYYVVIFWKNEPHTADDNPAVSVSSKVGTLIFLKVRGEIVEKGEISSFKTKPDKNYFWGLPVSFLVRFENLGNVHLKPVGEIRLTNFWGRTKILAVNELERNVLPGSVRRFEVVWGPTLSGSYLKSFWLGVKAELTEFAFGPYEAVLNLNYGVQPTEPLSQKISFWIIPYRLISVIVLAIVLLVILVKIDKKIKKLKEGERAKR